MQVRLEEVNRRQQNLNIRADKEVVKARKNANDETSRMLRQFEAEACVLYHLPQHQVALSSPRLTVRFCRAGNKETYMDLKKSAKRSIDLLPDQDDQRRALAKLEEIKETFRKIRVEYKEIGVAAAAGMVSKLSRTLR